MALSNVIKNWTDGSISLADGTTPTPLSWAGRFEDGDWSADGLDDLEGGIAYEHVVYRSRGVVSTIRKTEQRFPSGSFTLSLAEFTETSTGTFIDFVTAKAGTPYAARVSTLSGDVFAADMVLTVEGTDLGDAADHQATFTDCVFTYGISEGDPDKINVAWVCYGTITFA